MTTYKTFNAYMERKNGYGQYFLVLETKKDGRVIKTQLQHSTDSQLWDDLSEVENGSIEHRRIMRIIKNRF
jgi:hypothetical protein